MAGSVKVKWPGWEPLPAHYANNEYILAWWTKEHDLLRGLIAKLCGTTPPRSWNESLP